VSTEDKPSAGYSGQASVGELWGKPMQNGDLGQSSKTLNSSAYLKANPPPLLLIWHTFLHITHFDSDGCQVPRKRDNCPVHL